MNPGTYPGFGRGSGVAPSGFPLLQIPILTSQLWVVPITGWYLIAVIGGGGSGARRAASSNNRCTGGSAGGVAFAWRRLKKGEVISLAVGAGGAAPGVDGDGNAGGESTLRGAGLDILAKGGRGGLSATTAIALTGPDGGDAFGGDLNVRGGTPDGCTSATGIFFSGGAAVGIYGFTPPASNAIAPTGGGFYVGGGGVLGTSGWSAANGYILSPNLSNQSGANAFVAARSSGAPLLATTAGSENFPGRSNDFCGSLLAPIGVGGVATNTNIGVRSGGPGAGGCGDGAASAGNGGVFAGGGAVNTGGGAIGYGGPFGGGGGASPGSGPGGNGGVIIQFLGGE